MSDIISSPLTLTGDGTSLGSLRGGDVEIRAFGPQSPPLSDLKGFGVYRLGDEGDPWTAVAACPETWVEVKTEIQEISYRLDLRFLGVKSPLYFSFYLHAQQAAIGAELFQPKSLKKYEGEAKPAAFDGQILIQTDASTGMELIPLAGEAGCFWSSTFLLAFKVPINESKISFQIISVG